MKVGILTFEQWKSYQKNSIGSSRIRGTWIVEHMPEAELFQIGVKYDAIIFQKAYFIDYMKIFEGVKILDLCDPDWLDGQPIMEAVSLCDAITTSSEALAEFVRQVTDKPVVCIPDRVNMDAHKEKKVHEGKATGVVWFGYHQNQKTLDGAIQSLRRLGLSLTVISDMPYYPPGSIQGVDKTWILHNVKNVKFDPETINLEIINGGDVMLNPKLTTGKFKFKSENKTYIAWALGMPVARDSEELERFMDPEERKKESAARLKEVEELWRTELSVEQYREVIANVLSAKKQ